MDLSMVKNTELEIDFFHVDSFEVSVYLPIFKALTTLGVKYRAVIPNSLAGLVEQNYLDDVGAKAFYDKHSIIWTETPNYNNPVCSTQGAEFLCSYLGPKIRIPYGPNIYPQGWGLSRKSCLGFSDILVHGPHYKKHLSRFFDPKKIFISGYPKYDPFFSTIPNSQPSIRPDSAESQRNKPKPSLLILPTWGESSSLRSLVAALSALDSNYDITIKPHHLSYRKEPDLVERAKANPFVTVATESDSLIDLLKICDFVACDVRSCAFGEAILAKKSTIAISSNSNDIKWIVDSGVHHVAPVVTTYADALAEIGKLLEADKYKLERETWIRQKVAYRDGSSSRVSAEILAGISKQFSESGMKKNTWQIISTILSMLLRYQLISFRTARLIMSRIHWFMIKLLGNF
jgi:hypothetical protein